MDSAAADTLLAALRQSLAADPSCRLDASKVETLMLPGMQVILAAIRSNAKVRVVDPSPWFCAAFADAALSWVGNEGVRDDAAEPGPAAAGDPPSAVEEAPAPSLAVEQDPAPPPAAE
jgi:hypothetical protein